VWEFKVGAEDDCSGCSAGRSVIISVFSRFCNQTSSTSVPISMLQDDDVVVLNANKYEAATTTVVLAKVSPSVTIIKAYGD